MIFGLFSRGENSFLCHINIRKYQIQQPPKKSKKCFQDGIDDIYHIIPGVPLFYFGINLPSLDVYPSKLLIIFILEPDPKRHQSALKSVAFQEIPMEPFQANLIVHFNVHILSWLPSGKRLHNYGKIHHFQWVNQRTKWAMASIG